MTSSCPPLAPPPAEAIDALQNAKSPAIDAWAVNLDRHYQKLSICVGK